MAAPKVWVQAARLRTLPLSLSGIIMGNALALGESNFQPAIFLMALVTAIGFQVLSNFANDYGDGVKGTDTKDRLGPQRVIQQKLLTPNTLFKAIIWTAVCSIACALYLIHLSFGSLFAPEAVVFQVLALIAVIAAYTYTAGVYPYGYHGLGDVFVFLFFGLVAVAGSYYLQTQKWTPMLLYFSSVMGLLSVAVLNLNNLRDYKTDQAANKNTLVVFFGPKHAKTYHYLLVIGALISLIGGLLHLGMRPVYGVLILTLLFLLRHLVTVRKIQDPTQYDPELKVVALSSFGIAVLFLITQIV